MKLFLTLVSAILVLAGNSQQTTDILHYKIVYDQSGSVAKLDNNNNLEQLARWFLEFEKNKEIETPDSFQFVALGVSGTENREVDFTQYNTIEGHQKARLQLESFLTKNRRNPKTDLLSALEKLKRDTESESQSSAGWIIFTDGILEQGDIPEGDLIDSYREKVRKILDSISSRIFWVQVSPEPVNDFLKELTGEDSSLVMDEKKYIRKKNLFWVPTYMSIEELARLKEAFAHAISGFNYRLMKPRQVITGDTPPGTDFEKEDTAKTPAEKLILRIHNAAQIVEYCEACLATSTEKDIDRAIQECLKNISGNAADKNEDCKMQESLYVDLLQVMKGKKEIILPKLNHAEVQSGSAGNSQLLKLEEVRYVNKSESLGQMFLEGLTDYVVTRVKKEVAFSFVENVQSILFKETSDANRDTVRKFLEGWLPHTSNWFEANTQPGDLTLLQKAFDKDLQKLPDSFIESGVIQNILNGEILDSVQKEIVSPLIGMYAGYVLFKNLKSQENLAISFQELYNALDKLEEMDTTLTWIKSLKLAAGVIVSFGEYAPDSMYSQKETKELYLKLVAVASVNDTLMSCTELQNFLGVVKSILQSYNQVVKKGELILKFSAQQPSGNYAEYVQYQQTLLLDFYSSCLDLLSLGIGMFDSSSGNALLIQTEVKNGQGVWAEKMRNGIEIYRAFHDGRYLEGSMLILPVIQNILLKSTNLKSTSNNLQQIMLQLSNLLYIGSESVHAGSAGDISKIIAKYTLPVSSYKIKRHSAGVFSIGAYPGVALSIYLNQNSKEPKFAPAIICPIGLDYSFKNVARPKSPSFSIFVSILDIGNILDYRFVTHDSTAVGNYQLASFERVLSPGVMFHLGGFRKLPLAFTVGYQYNPHRFQLGITFDLPMFSFWKSARQVYRHKKEIVSGSKIRKT